MARYTVKIDGCCYEVDIDPRALVGDCLPVQVDGRQVVVTLSPELQQSGASGLAWVDGRPYEILADPCLRWIQEGSGLHQLEVHLEPPGPYLPRNPCGAVYAPIPGQVSQVLVQAGQQVAAGEPLLLLEAMKMQNELRAARGGVVKLVQVAAGQVVARGDLLVEVE